MNTQQAGIIPTTARGKRLKAAGFTVLCEVWTSPFSIGTGAPGKWYEVITPGGNHAVIGYQTANCIHAFGLGEWTASGMSEARCYEGGLGDAIETDAQMRGYKRLVLNAPKRLISKYDGLYRASSDAYNER